MGIRHTIVYGLVALALIVAGCGGDDIQTSATPSGEPADTADDTSTVPVDETEPDGEEAGGESAARRSKPDVQVPDGPPPKQLQTEDLIEGDGATAKDGDTVSVDYVGVAYSNGDEFDASYGGSPFELTLGAGEVIPGWDQGIVGMKVGSRRELIIPPDLAYGEQGFPPDIGPNETLVFVVDLLSVN